MEIRFLGAHNCETASSRCAAILVDGTLALDCGGLTSGLTFEEQGRIKTVLLTHHHYDHIRDLPLLAMNLFLQEKSADVYATSDVLRAVASHLMDGELYPDFTGRPESAPTIRFNEIKPDTEAKIGDYRVMPVAVNHAIPATGYYLKAAYGRSLFYTGDTGPGLEACWPKIAPQLLIIELTAPERFTGTVPGHLTPTQLKQELVAFRRLKGYIPRVVTVHMNLLYEKEIAREASAISHEIGANIVLAKEGMRLRL